MEPAPEPLNWLFTENEQSPCIATMLQVQKGGRPFLVLPIEHRCAAEVVNLYPAQTARARLAKAALKGMLRARLSVGIQRLDIPYSRASGFLEFLSELAGDRRGQFPRLGILAGNPNTSGQRLIILLFDPSARPAAVVKTGVTVEARRLITAERSILTGFPQHALALPVLRKSFETPAINAVALTYYPGRSPTASDATTLPKVLGSWIDTESRIPLLDTRSWRDVEEKCTDHPVFQSVRRRLKEHRVSAALVHGDFAPWNIRVSSGGEWTVVDWERAEPAGLPGWDWFHYTVQSSLLAERLSITKLTAKLEKLLSSKEFKDYGERARITGYERSLILLYLLHSVKVVKPSEGREQTEALLTALASGWADGK